MAPTPGECRRLHRQCRGGRFKQWCHASRSGRGASRGATGGGGHVLYHEDPRRYQDGFAEGRDCGAR
eukprot:3223354-Lingulodinium_polyedra.AAC.1